MKRHLAASIISILTCSAATAGIPMAEYLQKLNDSTARVFMIGVGEGLITANVNAKAQGKQQLYCAPDSLVLTNERMHQLVMSQFELLPREEALKLDASQLLIRGLMKTFPCK